MWWTDALGPLAGESGLPLRGAVGEPAALRVARPQGRRPSNQSLRGFVETHAPVASGLAEDSYLVDSASSHMLVSKIKPCMSKYKQLYRETANGSLYKLSFI